MEAKNKNALIGGLLAIVFVMSVGYAAFATQLNITSTASTTNTWDVHIKSITAGTPTGTATSESAVVGDDKLSATFKANLVSPGDSITYTVVVENSGTLKAKLSSLSFTQGSTNAITHSYDGIAEGDSIAANGGTDEFTVTVTYNSSVTSQPADADLTNELKMVLTYIQDTSA